MNKSSVVSCIAWATAIGLVMSQGLIEYWKKVYVGPEKALLHGLAMLATAALFQFGVIFSTFVFHRAARWRLLAVGLMIPGFYFLGYSIFWHATRLPYLIENLPIPAAVWAVQLMIMPLAMLGNVIVLIQLCRPNQSLDQVVCNAAS